jgi:hypothetical protein
LCAFLILVNMSARGSVSIVPTPYRYSFTNLI